MINDKNFVWDYVQSCTKGASAFSDCDPVWQCGAIGASLVLAVLLLLLVTIRLRATASRDSD